MQTVEQVLNNPQHMAELNRRVDEMVDERRELNAPITRRGAVTLLAWFNEATQVELRALVATTA
jgi:hypothetical protein